jgi:glyoxylase-like metal-dependent hydrolase (beta-lactamase superfamily II)
MGLEKLITLLPEIRVGVHPLEAHRLKKSVLDHPGTFYFEEGSKIDCGRWDLQVLHTPGHSAGGCCFWLKTLLPGFESVLFTGDTLFVGDCGRTDLDTGDVHQMFQSLQRIRALPPETKIYPGHAYHPEPSSTIEKELKRNAPLMAKSVEELARLP